MSKKIIMIAVALMLTVIVGSVSIYTTGNKSYRESREQAAEIAEKKAGIEKVDEFYWYNGKKSYYTVVGSTKKKDNKVVIINSDKDTSGNTVVLDQGDTITRKQAIQLTNQAKKTVQIIEARIGMEEDTPIWEVAYKHENGHLGYYVVSLKTGEWIKDIENI